ncbi:MAG: hypothetical protein KDA33_06955, partial [Phycisphaerales bacterium]|nr:hypothetical protein [Phycisphaerales bacterium]
VILIDVVMSARVGAYLLDDALVHFARIRNILNHGLNNTDPFVRPDYFFPMYHTNILYALIATISKLTGADPIDVWANSLAWVKLLVASGAYYLAYTISGRRWPAWAAAVFVIGVEGPVRFLIYPNKLAPFWLMPILFAFAAQAIARPADWRVFLKLLVGSLVIGQFHGMYAVFTAMIVGPVLLANALFRAIRPDKGRLWPALCCLTLGAGLVFAWISNARFTSTQSVATDSSIKAAPQKTAAELAKDEKRIRKLDDGRVVRIWGYGYFAHRGLRPKLLFLALGLFLVTERRRFAIAPAGVIAVAAAWLFVPTLCTLFMESVRRPFILMRFETVFRISFYAIVPTLAVFGLEKLLRGAIWGKDRDFCRPWAEKWNRYRLLRWPVEGAICLIVLASIIPYKNYGKPAESQITGWERYRTLAAAPRESRLKRRNDLKSLQQALVGRIPPGAVIAVSPREPRSMFLPAVHDCRLIAPRAGSTGVPDLSQRRRDLARIYTQRTAMSARLDILKRYDAAYFIGPDALIPDDKADRRWPMWPGSNLTRLKAD